MRPLLEKFLKVSDRHLRRIINEHEGKKKPLLSHHQQIKKSRDSFNKVRDKFKEVKKSDPEFRVVEAIDVALKVMDEYLVED
jgi:thymidylate kinase